jgi:hypothetical protein
LVERVECLPEIIDDRDRVASTGPRIGHWIDNSDQTPDETVDAILARLPMS